MDNLTSIIEAILFAAGDAVPEDLIKEKLGVTKVQLDSVVRQLERRYTGNCGIRLLRFNHKLQFATNPDFKDSIALVLMPIREREFTRTILECAAIIAYKQPITRSELEAIRGVNSDYAITTLLGLDMITVCGRRDTPGKPALYATTDNFLKRFKLKSLSELPDYEELMKKIAELNATDLTGSYLYEKDVYNPDEDPENAENGDGNGDSDGSGDDEPASGDFETPAFLDGEDDIIKIE